jgi:hypothetical protein
MKLAKSKYEKLLAAIGLTGIILSAEKDEVLVEYAMGGIFNKIFVSKYQLHLPDKKQLQKKVKAIMGPK